MGPGNTMNQEVRPATTKYNAARTISTHDMDPPGSLPSVGHTINTQPTASNARNKQKTQF